MNDLGDPADPKGTTYIRCCQRCFRRYSRKFEHMDMWHSRGRTQPLYDDWGPKTGRGWEVFKVLFRRCNRRHGARV